MLRMCREPHRRVRRTVAIVTAATLDHFEKETLIELLLVCMEELAAASFASTPS